jgi:hypothetical protein
MADGLDCLGLNDSREGEKPLGLQDLKEVLQRHLCLATGQQTGVDAWNHPESNHTCLVLPLLGLRGLNEAMQTGYYLELCCRYEGWMMIHELEQVGLPEAV